MYEDNHMDKHENMRDNRHEDMHEDRDKHEDICEDKYEDVSQYLKLQQSNVYVVWYLKEPGYFIVPVGERCCFMMSY